MHFFGIFPLLSLAASVIAAPLSSESTSVDIPNITTSVGDLNIDVARVNNTNVAGGGTASTRFRCGEYKFDDGTVQIFNSQVWAGLPRDQAICRLLNYDSFHKKAGQEGNMVAAKIDLGCTCYFYTSVVQGFQYNGTSESDSTRVPCDPSQYSETWGGWEGWKNYASTNKHFKGWWCHEHY